MSRVCDNCGKSKAFGGHITRRGLAIKAGGIGTHVVKNTKREFGVNLQPVRIATPQGNKKVRMCTSCIRTGNFTKV
ncbi:MAG: 50S ribosomal protein L28 [Victivallaceae bacterium]|nr:50S ribosomal protein L28 [Victivallaceae bacterium]MDD4181144.1 50S ribosomal protein L28 [Victivallaceae bacterium]